MPNTLIPSGDLVRKLTDLRTSGKLTLQEVQICETVATAFQTATRLNVGLLERALDIWQRQHPAALARPSLSDEG